MQSRHIWGLYHIMGSSFSSLFINDVSFDISHLVTTVSTSWLTANSPHIIAISVKLFNYKIVRYANLFPHLRSYNGTVCLETCSDLLLNRLQQHLHRHPRLKNVGRRIAAEAREFPFMEVKCLNWYFSSPKRTAAVTYEIKVTSNVNPKLYYIFQADTVAL